MISGRTTLVAHLGCPTESFKAPMIYNPWFERKGIDAVVVPMGVGAEDYPAFLRLLFRLSNILGALITMPHKATTVALLDEVSLAVRLRVLATRSCAGMTARSMATCSTGRALRVGPSAGVSILPIPIASWWEPAGRLGDRRFHCCPAAALARNLRHAAGCSREPRRAVAPLLPGPCGRNPEQRPSRLSSRRECHPARHAARRSAALRPATVRSSSVCRRGSAVD
jgi:hypothetical protein